MMLLILILCSVLFTAWVAHYRYSEDYKKGERMEEWLHEIKTRFDNCQTGDEYLELREYITNNADYFCTNRYDQLRVLRVVKHIDYNLDEIYPPIG